MTEGRVGFLSMQNLRHEILNATASIKGILLPYKHEGMLAEEDWQEVLDELSKIEKACLTHCKEKEVLCKKEECGFLW